MTASGTWRTSSGVSSKSEGARLDLLCKTTLLVPLERLLERRWRDGPDMCVCAKNWGS